MSHTGGCLCGAVTYEISEMPNETGACHCGMCQKWSGGVYLAVQVSKEHITFSGEDGIGTFRSSDWAQRGFCKKCGSSLYYQVTAPGPHQGNFHVALGTFDDKAGIAMTGEIFIDSKPDAYSFDGDHSRMTGAEIMAMFAPPAPEADQDG